MGPGGGRGEDRRWQIPGRFGRTTAQRMLMYEKWIGVQGDLGEKWENVLGFEELDGEWDQ